MTLRKRWGAVLLTVAVLAPGACAGAPEDAAPAADLPHGYVEGAEEAAEAQSRLVVADAGTGAVRVVDLITGEVHPAGRVAGVRGITGDGRFAYLTGQDDAVHVVDSGSWMVDHGDHVHYYRAAVREVGVLPGKRALGAYSDPVVAAVSYPDGTASLLDRTRLDRGEVAELGKVVREPHAGVAVPYAEHVLASDGVRGVRVHDRQGKPVADIEAPCPGLAGQALTRRGVIFGCADGALLVTGKDGAFTGQKIPYPGEPGARERATRFTHRPGGTTLAAPAGDNAVWSLDVSRRAWTRVETGPVAAVNAVGEGAPLLVLTRDGVLRAFDSASGRQRTQVRLMPQGTGAVIQVDNARAYVNNPAAGEIYEIDYNDNLRRARTFTVEGKASHLVETGR